MAIKEINDQNFSDTLKGNWLIMFYSTWCGPCLNNEYLFELDRQNKELNIGRINIEENSQLSEKYSIVFVPTFILLLKGKETKRIIGIKDKIFFQELIEGKPWKILSQFCFSF